MDGLLFAVAVLAGCVAGSVNGQECVGVRTLDVIWTHTYLGQTYNKYRYGIGKAATCGFVQSFSESVQDVQQNYTAFQDETEASLDNVKSEMDSLGERVEIMEKGKGQLKPFYFVKDGERRRYCDIFNMAEATHVCQLLGYATPDPRIVHVKCGRRIEACPTTFWKLTPGCYKPNGPNTLESCTFDPVGENCTNPVYVACEGFTTEFGD